MNLFALMELDLPVWTGYLSKGCRVMLNSNHVCHTSVMQDFWFESDKLVASCGVFEATEMQE